MYKLELSRPRSCKENTNNGIIKIIFITIQLDSPQCSNFFFSAGFFGSTRQ